MPAVTEPEDQKFKIVTRDRLWGDERRWRRFGEPVPAGKSLKEDSTPDYGIFGPGSMVWQVLLHPATVVFQFAAQGALQTTYMPIVAGIRDRDPLSRNARKGTLTLFDLFDRGQRNSGMHAPMWLGDTTTARRMAKHLTTIHKRVTGDIIDVGRPEMGGYAAAEPREVLWATLTEMHSMLWLYESFAFRDGRLPHRLLPEERDRYFAEVAAYCRLLGASEEEIPHSSSEVAALYKKYAEFFKNSPTMNTLPDSGEDFTKLYVTNLKKNFHRSQIPAAFYALGVDHGLFRQLFAGAASTHMRRSMGMGPLRSMAAVAFTKLALPLVWLLQLRPFERHYMRLMWGPDGVRLIKSARTVQSRFLRTRAQED